MYFALDIETTGLRPDFDQILSVAMIADDLITPIEELKKFYMVLKHKTIHGDAMALAMNKQTLLEIANGIGELPYTNVQKHYQELLLKAEHVLLTPIYSWLHDVWEEYAESKSIKEPFKATFAGKNVAGFDLPFLRFAYNKCGTCLPFQTSHRVIDVGSMFYDPKVDGSKVPNLEECKRRANILTPVSHHALDDAMDIVNCIRAKLG